MTIDQSAVVIGSKRCLSKMVQNLYLCVIGKNMVYQSDWQEMKEFTKIQSTQSILHGLSEYSKVRKTRLQVTSIIPAFSIIPVLGTCSFGR